MDTLPIMVEKKETKPYGDSMGQVKWFNPKLGYGFVTFIDGSNKGKDIFVHHTGIKPLNCGYHTLEMGEYIQFNVTNGMNGLQASDVTGIKGGPLMCDVVFKRSGSDSPQSDTPFTTVRPKNKLKYSKEGRAIMKAAAVSSS